MNYADDTLKRYYLDEMRYLRDESVAFAQSHADVAQQLALNGEPAADPQIEMMLQSFALLVGRQRYQMELDDALLPSQLLATLCPQLESPWPAASVVQFDVTKGGQRIASNSVLSTEAKAQAETACRFVTRYETAVEPVALESCRYIPLNEVSHRAGDQLVSGCLSALQLKLTSTDGQPLTSERLTDLNLMLQGEKRFVLHDQLNRHLKQILLFEPGKTVPLQMLNADALQFRGLEADESLLPLGLGVNPGLVLLREYFLFPEKFLFARLNGLQPVVELEQLELVLLFDTPALSLTAPPFALNCAPVINLFRQSLEPTPLSAGQLEYRLTADQFHHDQLEVHSLIDLSLLRANGEVAALQPLYGDKPSSAGYWSLRREPSQRGALAGTELYMRLLTEQFEAASLPGAHLIGRAWCSNRSLPESLIQGEKMQLEAAGAVQSATLLRQTTRHLSAVHTGDQGRALVAQINSNYLPLTGGAQGLTALKQLLNQHCPSHNHWGLRQLQGVVKVSSRMIGRRVGHDSWRGYCHGTELEVVLDTAFFDNSSIALFGAVLNEALAHFVTLNSFVQLRLSNLEGELLQSWPARSGEQCLL